MKWALAAIVAVVALVGVTLAQAGAAPRGASASSGARSTTASCVKPTPVVTPLPSWNPVAGTDALPPASATPVASPTVILPNPANGVLTVTLTANPPSSLNISGAPLVASPFTTTPPSTAPTSLDGPTLHVNPGGKIDLTFCNELGDYQNNAGKMVPLLANIHYHGLHVEPNVKADNIFRTFGPGESKSFVNVPTDQPAGTYWYHVHYHGLSEREVMGGLSGLLIVDPIQPKDPAAPRLNYLLPGPWAGVPQQQLTLRDVQLNSGTNVVSSSIAIFQPSTRLVDGFYQPTFTMPTNRWEILRLANIGADIFYKVVLRPTGDTSKTVLSDVPLYVIGEDGLPVWRPRTAVDLVLPPGKRFDVLVHVPTAGTYGLLSVPYVQGAKVTPETPPPNQTFTPKPLPKSNQPETLATLNVTAATGPLVPAGNIPPEIAPERPASAPVPEYEQNLAGPNVVVAQRREFVFGYNTNPKTGAMQSIINKVRYGATNAELLTAVAAGHPFEHTEAPLADPVVGTVEQWKLVNTTLDDHPFHIHINGFQVISIDGHAVAQPDGHQDIVNVPRQVPKLDSSGKPVVLPNGKIEMINGTVVIRQRFVHYTGWWVFHCHILQHEDNGMMATIEVRANKNVVPTPPPKYVMDGLPKPPVRHTTGH